MYRESVSAGMPMTPAEVGEAFGMSVRWGRERVAEVGADLAELAERADPADRAEPVTSENTVDGENEAEPVGGRGWDSPEARTAGQDDLLRRAERVADPEEAADLREQAAEEVAADRATAVENEDVGEASRADVAGEVAREGVPKRSAVLTQHLRIRWGVRATLTLGVVASTVANVLHAHDNPISQTIAAWPPLALLATIELISRVPVGRRWLAAVRYTATAVIAGIAAWVSYGHMCEVIRRYGETGASPYLIPLTVDGLVVVASVCLVELGSRIRALSAEVAK